LTEDGNVEITGRDMREPAAREPVIAHHGDGSPGVHILVMDGVEEFHREINPKG
jgi:hypothetical protein